MKRRGLIGTSVPRIDGVDKVTGKTQFSHDFWMEGMLYGGVLRSPHPSARIVAIHTNAASQLPGVRAVVTALDIPGRKCYGGPTVLDHPVLAGEKEYARYYYQVIFHEMAKGERKLLQHRFRSLVRGCEAVYREHLHKAGKHPAGE